MIFSVAAESSLKDVPKECQNLHFVRPVRKEKLEAILKKCSNLEKVSMSKSCLDRMPKKNVTMLEKKGVAIKTQARQGRPISMPLEKMQHVLEMRKDYQSLREVEKVTGVSKSTVHYLEKYAKRAKIKNGKKVIYLK